MSCTSKSRVVNKSTFFHYQAMSLYLEIKYATPLSVSYTYFLRAKFAHKYIQFTCTINKCVHCTMYCTYMYIMYGTCVHVYIVRYKLYIIVHCTHVYMCTLYGTSCIL